VVWAGLPVEKGLGIQVDSGVVREARRFIRNLAYVGAVAAGGGGELGEGRWEAARGENVRPPLGHRDGAEVCLRREEEGSGVRRENEEVRHTGGKGAFSHS